MIRELALLPGARTIRRLDVLSVMIVIGFAAFGLFAGLHLWGLAGLHRGLLGAATGLESTGLAIASLADLPLVGDAAQRQADNVVRTATEVRTGALAVRDSVQMLAVVVGVAIVLLAVVPVAVLYLPLRLARRRQLSELRRMLSEPIEPMLVEHLAREAVRRAPYRELRQMSQHRGVIWDGATTFTSPPLSYAVSACHPRGAGRRRNPSKYTVNRISQLGE